MKTKKLFSRISVFAVAVCMFALSLATILAVSKTAYAVENGKIVYMKQSDGTSDIYSINSDGTDETQLTNDGESAYPMVSPDGTKVAYINFEDEESFDLYTMNIDGSNKVDTDTDIIMSYTSFMWNDSSTKIFGFDGQTEIGFIMDPDGNNKISNGIELGSGPYSSIDYSLDSSKMIYGDGSTFSIYIADPDGGNPVKINSVAAALNPVYSYDDSKVFFIGAEDPGGDSFYLYSVNPDGTGETLISEVSLPYPPQPSPVNNQLVSVGGADGVISIVDTIEESTDTIDLNSLLEDDISEYPFFPAWSPDGNKLTFALELSDGENTQADLFTINADGSGLTNMTNSTESYEYTMLFQAWAPVPGTTDDTNDGDSGSSSPSNQKLSYTDSKTGKLVTLSLPTTVTNASVSAIDPTTIPSDGTLNQPAGLTSFQFDTTQGNTETITLYYDLPGEPSDYQARKYNTTDKAFTDIDNASITRTTYQGSSVLALTYDITDGGVLDQDNEANGTIVDPVGLATATNDSELSDTGQNTILLTLSSITLIIASITILLRLKSKKSY